MAVHRVRRRRQRERGGSHGDALGGTLVVNQSVTLTATVTGATDTSVTWSCTFTTSTTPAGSTTPVISAAAPCTAAQGALSNQQTTTVTFTAPATVPNPPPTITVVATSNRKKENRREHDHTGFRNSRDGESRHCHRSDRSEFSIHGHANNRYHSQRRNLAAGAGHHHQS